MARVTYVKKARKDQGSCTKCGTPIKAGDAYKWFANRIGRSSMRKNFCSNCTIRASDKTTSHHLGALYSATESVEDMLGSDGVTLSDMAEALQTCADEVQEVADGYRESQEAIVDGFGHETYQSDELGEKADELESFSQDLAQASGEVESLPDPDAEEEDLLSDLGIDKEDEDWEDQVEREREERRTAATSVVEEALGACPM